MDEPFLALPCGDRPLLDGNTNESSKIPVSEAQDEPQAALTLICVKQIPKSPASRHKLKTLISKSGRFQRVAAGLQEAEAPPVCVGILPASSFCFAVKYIPISREPLPLSKVLSSLRMDFVFSVNCRPL